MSKSDRLGKLFSALGRKNWESAYACAEEICAYEEHQGHSTVARLLRSSLNGRSNGQATGSSNGVVGGTLLSALQRQKSKVRLSDVFLRKQVGDQINQLVLEFRSKEKIAAKGIPLRSKVLLHGPPGCGKSLTSLAIANELNLPAYLVRFDAVIGSYLGQTAANLRQIFQFVESTPCVVLIDELDALGKKRGNPMDVGELDRIAISLMQELEHTKPAGILIATSNLPKHLDDALWRRFDLTIQYPKPNKNELMKFARALAKKFELRVSSELKQKIEKCKSLAEAELVVQDKVRRLVLQELS